MSLTLPPPVRSRAARPAAPVHLRFASRVLAAALLAGAIDAGPVAASGQTHAPPAGPLSVRPGSAYAHAKQGCWRQGEQLKLVGAQTDDAKLATDGVNITSVCVAPAAAARSGATRTKRGHGKK
ncbi:MAG: hypothetical protein E7812_13495 [Phenylobacterium sp.]|nr:MAG: hypothetical protein E7812_13495 [Phenylobacterium sp.]